MKAMVNRILIMLFVVVTSFASQAQDTVFIEHNTMPKLGGHEFVQQPLIRTPFINTSFRMRMGVQSTNGIKIPLPDFLPDSLGGLSGDLFFVNLSFAYFQKIKDWIGFYAKLEGNVRSGTEVGSILSEGINTLIGGETGVTFRVLENERHMLSGSFNLSNYDATIIDVGQFVRDIINGEPDASITKEAPALSVGFGARYAFAINKVIGLMANADLLYGENIVRGDEAFRASFGAACDLNFKSKGVPLGLSVGYSVSSAPEIVYVDNEFAHTLAIKGALTAAPDFLIGLELVVASLPLTTADIRASTVGAMLNINYFFN